MNEQLEGIQHETKTTSLNILDKSDILNNRQLPCLETSAI